MKHSFDTYNTFALLLGGETNPVEGIKAVSMIETKFEVFGQRRLSRLWTAIGLCIHGNSATQVLLRKAFEAHRDTKGHKCFSAPLSGHFALLVLKGLNRS